MKTMPFVKKDSKFFHCLSKGIDSVYHTRQMVRVEKVRHEGYWLEF